MTTRVPAPVFGQRFGKLKVIIGAGRMRRPGRKHWIRAALVVCDCGSPMKAVQLSVLGKLVNSCGCNQGSPKHGMQGTPEYRAWADAKQRCYNPNHKRYSRYGARGIYMCDEWLNSFEAFYAYMGPRPSPAHTLERKDNDKPYCPENCVWAIWDEQWRTRSTSLIVTYQGQQMTMTEAAVAAGIPPARALDRRRRGLPESEWFNPENRQGGSAYVTYQGERMKIVDAADRAGVNVGTVRRRIRQGWPEADWFKPARPIAGVHY